MYIFLHRPTFRFSLCCYHGSVRFVICAGPSTKWGNRFLSSPYVTDFMIQNQNLGIVVMLLTISIKGPQVRRQGFRVCKMNLYSILSWSTAIYMQNLAAPGGVLGDLPCQLSFVFFIDLKWKILHQVMLSIRTSIITFVCFLFFFSLVIQNKCTCTFTGRICCKILFFYTYTPRSLKAYLAFS